MTEARTALVTGASRGIGFGIALRLAEEGFRTAIVGRNRRRVEEAAKEITEISGTQALAVVGDVSSWSDCVAAVEKVVKEFGAIDALAAQKGLRIYAEHTADAESFPGKHPNIDRLIEIAAKKQALAVRLIAA